MARRSEKAVYWGALILDWFQYLRDPDFRSSDYKVLFLLCENMKYDDNTAYIKQKQIAEHLNMDKGNVSKSIKRLYDKQFITKRENGFMINPHLFYVGKSINNRRDLRNHFDQLLINKGSKPIFYLNEDDNILETTLQNNNFVF